MKGEHAGQAAQLVTNLEVLKVPVNPLTSIRASSLRLNPGTASLITTNVRVATPLPSVIVAAKLAWNLLEVSLFAMAAAQAARAAPCRDPLTASSRSSRPLWRWAMPRLDSWAASAALGPGGGGVVRVAEPLDRRTDQANTSANGGLSGRRPLLPATKPP